MSNISGRRDIFSGGNTIEPTRGSQLNLNANTVVANGTLNVDRINEYSSAAGVRIENSLLRDGIVSTDVVNEFSNNAGCTIESVLIKDGRVLGLSEPLLADEPATKFYVDSLVSGLYIKEPCRVATTAALPTNTVPNVNTIVADDNGVISIDGVTLDVADRVLVKNETDQTKNGLYYVFSPGAVDSVWILKRTADADNTDPSNEVRGGISTLIQEGTVNQGKTFALTSPTDTATIGTDNIVFTELNTNYTVGTGLTLTGHTVSLTAPVSIALGGTNATTAADARTNLGLGTISTLTIPSAGHVSSNGSALTSSATIPVADVSGALAASSNLSDVTNSGTARTNLGLGSISTQAIPSAGYVKSNGTTITSSATIPAADVVGLTISDEAEHLIIRTNGGTAPGGVFHHEFRNGTDRRIALGMFGNETGSGNTGSDFAIYTYDDNETFIDNPITITRSTGVVHFSQAPTFDEAATTRTNLGLGSIATQAIPSSGYVKSNGSAISSSATIANTDITGLGTLSTHNLPASGYVTSNGSALSSTSTIPSSDVSFTSGFTITGGTVNINHNSNFDVNVGTGTNTSTAVMGNINNTYTGIAGSTVGLGVASGGIVHVADTYWVGDSIANHVSVGNGHASSTVKIQPKTLVGPDTTVTDAQLKVSNGGTSQLQVGSSFGATNNGGGWLSSANPSEINVYSGAHDNGGTLTSTATTAHFMHMSSGAIDFYVDDGLTVGNTFTATKRMSIDTEKVDFIVPPVYDDTYMVGYHGLAGFRLVGGIIDMSDTGLQTGDNWKTSDTNSQQGSILVEIGEDFTQILGVVATPIYNNDSSNLGVLALVRRSSLVNGAFRIRTINSGTGALIWLEGSDPIKCSFLAFGI